MELSISVDLQPKKVETSNTLAFLEGSDPKLKGEFVVIGAHHDHLGMGGPGSFFTCTRHHCGPLMVPMTMPRELPV